MKRALVRLLAACLIQLPDLEYEVMKARPTPNWLLPMSHLSELKSNDLKHPRPMGRAFTSEPVFKFVFKLGPTQDEWLIKIRFFSSITRSEIKEWLTKGEAATCG